ncbi:alpha-humulene synthase isoform X1 [Sorghum bicolor]|nr:alpha-humulene synthase isoform X1 [Sorghum bicolor]|eukprot:XP_021320375.1 alpha-humulene synthase isoform X1 [Sorghum bicolor]
MDTEQSSQSQPVTSNSKVVYMAAKEVVVNKETKNTMVAATAAGAYLPACVWGDFFVTYTPSLSQRSEEWMRERADELKGQVRRMFVTGGKDMSIADMLSLVDTLKRLGIDNHFHEEIDLALSHIHTEDQDNFHGSNDLHVVALRFGLLRQHGLWVSADVFDKFRDAMGSFSMDLATDSKGLLSLYNAAHMAVPGEAVLDDAVAFARRHLEAAKGKLIRSPMVEQVSRALNTPRPRWPRRLEAMHYITEYEQEDEHNAIILELARLDFSIVRSVYIEEIKNLSLWWRDLYNDVKLPYARNRIVETHLFSSGVFPEKEHSRARIIFTKTFAFLSLMDDTYDTHATLEECQKLTEAIQRWDESMVPILPEYLRMFYIKLLRNYKEIEEDILEPWEKNRMADFKKSFKLVSKSYLKEAEWFSQNYTPSFKEHIDFSITSTGLPMLSHVALMGAGQLATKEAFDWALDMPDLVKGMAETGRFFNDISSYYKPRNSLKDVVSSLECYMKEHDMTPNDATVAFETMVEHAWRRINKAYMELDHGILPAAQVVVNMARTVQMFYRHGRDEHGIYGRDAYTFGDTLKETIASLLLKDFPI